jgi:hypothetical protein
MYIVRLALLSLGLLKIAWSSFKYLDQLYQSKNEDVILKLDFKKVEHFLIFHLLSIEALVASGVNGYI